MKWMRHHFHTNMHKRRLLTAVFGNSDFSILISVCTSQSNLCCNQLNKTYYNFYVNSK